MDSSFLKKSMAYGGYVAGGFARIAVANILHNYVLQGKIMSDELRNSCEGIRISSLLRGLKTDIDIFFPNKYSATVAPQTLATDHVVRTSCETKGGWGIEYTTKSITKFQHITKSYGAPVDIVSGFDLANAKVYFDSSGIYWTDEWLELENTRTIGIDVWDKQNLLWRINKWAAKHGYERIRKNDEELLFEHIITMITKMKEKKFFRFGSEVHVEHGLAHIWRMTKVLNFMPETLISLAMLFDSYRNIALIKKASGVVNE